MAVKALTGNVEVITSLNRLSHSIAYTQLEEVGTAWALNKLQKRYVAVPTKIIPGIPTGLAYDNIDRPEETLSCAGTSHRVIGIAFQPKAATVQPQNINFLPKGKRRSIQTDNVPLPHYKITEKLQPPIMQVKATDAAGVIKEAHQKDIAWVAAGQVDSRNQKVSAWTGFNMQTRDQVSSLSYIIHCLFSVYRSCYCQSRILQYRIMCYDAYNVNFGSYK